MYFLPPVAFIITTIFAAIVLSIVLLAVGLPLKALNRYRYLPLLAGTSTLAGVIYVGLPILLNPAVSKDLDAFLGRTIGNVLIIDAMVSLYWAVRQGSQNTNTPSSDDAP